MHSLASSFFVLIVLSVAFVAIGLLIAFWPSTYLRWVRSSKVESYAPWVFRGWDHGHDGWLFRIVGIGMTLFGVTGAILTVWIYWFQ